MMIKKIAVACLCMVLGSSLNAKDMSIGEAFIGLEIGYAEVQGNRGGFFYERDYTGNDVAIGFRLGAQNDEWRAMIIYDHYDNNKDKQNLEMGFLAIDYFFMGNESSSETTFSPYIGANVGYANYESTGIDDNNALYGAQVGFVVGVMETIDLDFGYRYSFSNSDELDHVANFVFAINYMY